ncbi:DedA family protein [Nocardiopsis flavescens]|uniref:Membrane protein DedA, SNARE-associated domain n=1 Tax=Nocardiopsis flavescens TaxID=758803 RepID=A0A1M6V8L5_9ACTN|nr:VTT domain-containing protein [Nocardiopsis flavescens]SHK77847.1 membrane protein DedA, SNARE-associated domain [Nocardiopsis flavescens]
MPQFAFLEGQPFWVVYFTLLVVILLRAPATYWIGRGLGAGVNRSRVGARLGPRLERAKNLVDRYGAPVVTLSFFTVGMQTAINLSAGVVRMRFPRYFAAVFLGGLAWAGLWGMVIAGLVGTWLKLFLDSPWTAVGVFAAGAALVTAMVVLRRRRGSGSAEAPREPGEEPPAPGDAADGEAASDGGAPDPERTGADPAPERTATA